MKKFIFVLFAFSLTLSACAVKKKTAEKPEVLEENQRAYIPLIPDGAGEQIFLIQ